MVENRRYAVCAPAIALIHSNHIHARGNAFGGNARHVLRISRTFEAVNNNDGERSLTVCLPMAMAHCLHTGLDLHQTLFAGRELNAAVDEEAGDGLGVSAAQPTAGHKLVLLQLSLRSHCN